MDKKITAKEIRAQREIVAKKSGVYAERLAQKLDARMEKLLFDAEQLVKSYFPAKFVSASLTMLQKELVANGISTRFDKRVTKEAIKKTASTDITEDECKEAIQVIAKNFIGETEKALEMCDTAIKQLSKKHFPKNRVSSVKAMRTGVENIMAERGMNIKL